MQLFQVALIQHPTKKETEEGQSSTLIMEPTAVLAKDHMMAAVQAVAKGKEKIGNIDMARVEVLVRPF